MKKKKPLTAMQMRDKRTDDARKRFKEKDKNRKEWMGKSMKGELSQDDLNVRKKLSEARDKIAKANSDLEVKIWQDEVKKKYGGGLT